MTRAQVGLSDGLVTPALLADNPTVDIDGSTDFYATVLLHTRSIWYRTRTPSV